MGKLKLCGTAVFEYICAFLKWCIISAVVGLVGGALGSLFHISIDYVTKLRNEHNWILYFLPIGGVLIMAAYRFFGKKDRINTDRVIEAVQTEKNVPFVMAPLIFFATVITHFLGGSAGREGAALQLGGSIGYNLGRLFRLDKNDAHIVVMVGMSAVFSALFGTPLTATFFSIEVICVGVVHYAALVPCLVASIVAARVAMMFGISPVAFELAMNSALSIDIFVKISVLAILCALVAILFCFSIKKTEHFMEKYLSNAYLRAFTGGAVIVVLTIILNTRDYNGAGMDVIARAISGDARPEAFILKILFTAITIAAGFKGGEIVPSFFIGSTFGCFAGGLLGIDPCLGAAIGCVALFCSVVNCPFASLILALELFGADMILVFALVCGISFMMSGRFGLYHSQKFVYSKIKDEFADLNVG